MSSPDQNGDPQPDTDRPDPAPAQAQPAAGGQDEGEPIQGEGAQDSQ